MKVKLRMEWEVHYEVEGEVYHEVEGKVYQGEVHLEMCRVI